MLGAHNPRLDLVRALRTQKGRAEQRRFAFEGSTLIAEALRSGIRIEEVYVTGRGVESLPAALERLGVPLYRVDDRTMARLSDLETPPGSLAVSPIALAPLARLFEKPGLVLVLADLSDPGNAGTLLRAAEAFGAAGVVFGGNAVEPYAPKVVRGAMGSVFRVPLASGSPAEVAAAAAGWEITGLDTRGQPLRALRWESKSALVVGQERRGLGAWEAICTRLGGIEMAGPVDSLNAAVAGSIALYEAVKQRF